MSVFRFFGFFLGLVFLFISDGNAFDYKNLTAPEVKKMLDENKALLIHVLSKIEFEMQHIPGSINIPITQVEKTHDLPPDMGAPIIFYCMGLR